MAKLRAKNKAIKKSASKIKNQINSKTQKGIICRLKLTESYTCLILGVIVVLVIGIIILFIAGIRRNMQTSSARDLGKSGQISQDSKTSSTYTVRTGDDLWTISENAYNNGYKWIEIAQLNNLQNPGLIYVGDKLILPSKSSENVQIAQQNNSAQNTIKNNSITGNTYTVVKGDNLWNIAVRAYGDGYKWVKIAQANNLVNPGLIHPGNFFKIPR